jgi:hypothetical protein
MPLSVVEALKRRPTVDEAICYVRKTAQSEFALKPERLLAEES